MEITEKANIQQLRNARQQHDGGPCAAATQPPSRPQAAATKLALIVMLLAVAACHSSEPGSVQDGVATGTAIGATIGLVGAPVGVAAGAATCGGAGAIAGASTTPRGQSWRGSAGSGSTVLHWGHLDAIASRYAVEKRPITARKRRPGAHASMTKWCPATSSLRPRMLRTWRARCCIQMGKRRSMDHSNRPSPGKGRLLSGQGASV